MPCRHGRGEGMKPWLNWSTAVRTSSSTRSALIAIAAADPSPAAVITCARGSATLPATQTPGDAGAAGASWGPSRGRRPSQPEPGQHVGCGDEARADEHRGRGMTRPSAARRPQAVVVDDQPGDVALDDADAAGGELFALVGVSAPVAGKRTTSADHGAAASGRRRASRRARRAAGRGPRSHGSRGVQQVAYPIVGDAGESGSSSRSPVATRTRRRQHAGRRRARTWKPEPVAPERLR